MTRFHHEAVVADAHNDLPMPLVRRPRSVWASYFSERWYPHLLRGDVASVRGRRAGSALLEAGITALRDVLRPDHEKAGRRSGQPRRLSRQIQRPDEALARLSDAELRTKLDRVTARRPVTPGRQTSGRLQSGGPSARIPGIRTPVSPTAKPDSKSDQGSPAAGAMTVIAFSGRAVRRQALKCARVACP
ncbi:hypothetical protein HNP84_007199 [Thermocatellispora tengchongensis]|uniref:Membrane dipeptidase n=1 Tax=Thermocatellispora tengchongensis TaxID=1073253 RepID=A0A840PK50_9ACTN|nr:hypothetical protein [Thermocatellispora tengchongensis]MBB5137447.1 hypothetical protein [Thermocatellispora tengchongensis]